jgi:hypothetical protein
MERNGFDVPLLMRCPTSEAHGYQDCPIMGPTIHVLDASLVVGLQHLDES